MHHIGDDHRATSDRVRPEPVHPDDDPLGDTVIWPRRSDDPAADDTDDTLLRPRPRPRPSERTDDDDDDVDGDTVLRPPAAVSSPGATADRVASIRDRDRGLQAVQQAPARVPSIRIAGTVHRLDRPVIVGRRPALPRVVRGTPPELVTVPSRRSEVSSSHLMVRAEGDAVVVEDLGSTNGTVVRPPGAAPTRMPSGASIVVLTGTVVEIGDGNTIEILSPYLRLQPPQHGADRTVPWPSATQPRNAPQPESDPDT